jgi:murein DD-endopeptidase MepM/ murein hydrolase activator NlpD
MNSEFIYSLPFKPSVVYVAVSDPEAHSGNLAHAVDFLMDFGQEILAPLDGMVWNVKDDSIEGGNNEKYADWKYQNLITLKHSDTEYSQYVHLAHKSALVKIGDQVRKGQPIAEGVGMVGYTTAPHLHMLVFKILSEKDNNFESKKIKFENKIKIIRKQKELEREFEKPINKRIMELEKQYNP